MADTYNSRDPDGHRDKLREVLLFLSQWQDMHEFVPFVQDNAYGVRTMLNDARAMLHSHLENTKPDPKNIPEDRTL